MFKEKFPSLFKRPISLEVGPGWVLIVEKMLRKIAQCDLPKGFEIIQIKEKFGELRVYYSPSQNSGPIYEAVKEALWACSETCDKCGSPGELLNDDGWLKVRCKYHHAH